MGSETGRVASLEDGVDMGPGVGGVVHKIDNPQSLNGVVHGRIHPSCSKSGVESGVRSLDALL